jgi:ABC-type iron transport system FetAB ATPase subunit
MLLRLCNRLEVATSGTSLCGRPIAGHEPQRLRREVGMRFLRPALFAGTVRDDLLLAAYGSGDDELRAGLERVGLERVGLDPGVVDRDATSPSGGEASVCV